MLLSIIIPSFQQSALLKEALKSIQVQTFKDYEVIIMDGGSKDDTANVITEFKNLPIKFKSEPDKGIYDAMNKGINCSSGDFLYFMGCDDRLFSNDVLEKIFTTPAVLHNHVIYGDAVFSDTGIRYDGEFTYFKLFDKNICHQSIFTHRKVFEYLGEFDIRYKIYADWEFNMRWFTTAWVRREYIPITISYFNASGFSSTLQDEVFYAEQDELRNKYFPSIVQYLIRNPHKPLHYRLMKFLTYKRINLLKKLLKHS